jgi:hypothetical protein
MSHRDMIRRVLYITGGVASTATILSTLGCGTMRHMLRLDGVAVEPG